MSDKDPILDPSEFEIDFQDFSNTQVRDALHSFGTRAKAAPSTAAPSTAHSSNPHRGPQLH